MRYLALLLATLVVLVACSAVVDTRDAATAAATRTAIASQPVTSNVGVLRLRLLTVPPVAIEPSLAPTVTPTPCRTVAGNINAQGKKLYHTADSPQFGQVKIDESKGERWFCDEQSAIDAGWVKAGQ